MHTDRVVHDVKLRTATALLCLVLAPGCATLGGSDPEPRFDTVAVVTRGQADVDLEADSTMRNAMVGGGAGAVSAGVIGAGAGALAGAGTGPFAVVFMPAAAAAGALWGAVGGGTVGVIVGGLQGLPSDKAEEVTRVLSVIGAERDYQAELRTNVEANVPEDRRGTTDRSDALAVLQITELELEQHLSDHLSIRVRGVMTIEWGPDPMDRDSKEYDYEFQSAEQHMDDWLADDGVQFAATFDEALATLTREMSNDLLRTSAP